MFYIWIIIIVRNRERRRKCSMLNDDVIDLPQSGKTIQRELWWFIREQDIFVD
jgi:hypothetical protein